MCHYLLQKTSGKKYDTKGLFLQTVATYFEESSTRCKTALETLMTFICHLHAKMSHTESLVHHLVMDWLGDSDPLRVGIGAKVLSFIVDDKITLAVAKKRFNETFLRRPLGLIDEDEVNVEYGVAITYVLQLLTSLLQANKEEVVKEAVKLETLANLLLHSCMNVRIEVVKLWSLLLKDRPLDLSWIQPKLLKQVRMY